MSLIHDALKTAQQEKQQRDAGMHSGPTPLIVPLRSKESEARFSWQRAASIGVGGAVLLGAMWFAMASGRKKGARVAAAVPLMPVPVDTTLAPGASVPVTTPPAIAADARTAGSSKVVRTVDTTTSEMDRSSARTTAAVRIPMRRPAPRAPASTIARATQPADSALAPAPVREPVQSGRLRIAVEQPRGDDAARLFAMGVAAHRAGDLATARNAYERVLIIAPNDVDALNNMGVLLAASRELDRAEQMLRRAVFLSPRNAGAWNNLGTVLAQRAQSTGAIAAYEHALSIDPHHQGARVSLAQQHLAIGSADRARELLEEVLAVNPALPEAHYALGQAFELQKDWSAAIRAYSAFVRVAPPRLAGDIERVRARVDALARRSR